MAKAINRRTVLDTAMREFNARRAELDVKAAEVSAQQVAAQQAAQVRLNELERQREYALQTAQVERLQQQQQMASATFDVQINALRATQQAGVQKNQVQQQRYQDLIGATQQKTQAVQQRYDADQQFNNMVGAQAAQGSELLKRLANEAMSAQQALTVGERRRSTKAAAEGAALGVQDGLYGQSSAAQRLADVSRDLDNYIKSARNIDTMSSQEMQQLQYAQELANTLRQMGYVSAEETERAAGLNEEYANKYADASMQNIDATQRLNDLAARAGLGFMSDASGASGKAFQAKTGAINDSIGAQKGAIQAETNAAMAQLSAQTLGIRESYSALSRLQNDYMKNLREQLKAEATPVLGPTNPYYQTRSVSPSVSPNTAASKPSWLQEYIPPKGAK